MGDLTIEYRKMCSEWYDYCTLPKFLKDGREEPSCKWDEEWCEGKAENGKCPECGGDVTIYRIGV
jgi:hypothetical protein